MINVTSLFTGLGLAYAAATSTFAATVTTQMTVGQSQTGSWSGSQDAIVALNSVSRANVTRENGTVTLWGTSYYRDYGAPAMTFNGFDSSLGTLVSANIRYTLLDGSRSRVRQVRSSCTGGRNIGSIYIETRDCSDYSADAVTVSSMASATHGFNVEAIPDFTPLGSSPTMEAGVTGSGNLSSREINQDFTFPELSTTLVYDGAFLENFIGSHTYEVRPLSFISNTVTARCTVGSSPDLFVDTCSGTTRVVYSALYQIDVDYVYTPVADVAPVPLPASALLLMSGMVGLAFARHRRT